MPVTPEAMIDKQTERSGLARLRPVDPPDWTVAGWLHAALRSHLS